MHESCQRKGCGSPARPETACASSCARDPGLRPHSRRLGRTLFDAVVEREGVDAAHLAYDRPSAKARAARGAASTGASRALARSDCTPALFLAAPATSAQMMPFLAKNFGLREHVQQPNNFVVFKAYFE